VEYIKNVLANLEGDKSSKTNNKKIKSWLL